MEELNELVEQRKKKLEELRSMGVEPYSETFNPVNSARELAERFASKTHDELEAERVECSIAGRIIALRNFGKVSFSHLQDGSDEKIQLYFAKNILSETTYLIFKKIDIGDIIGVSGRLFKTKTDELTIEVLNFKILSKSLRPLPEKWHGLKDVEIRYRQRYVDLIVNPEVRKTFAIRSKLVKAIRDFLESHGFIEVETPMMHPIPGGAAAKPFKTHHNALSTDLYLRIAPELYLKRLLVGGYERIFEINKNFRNEGISTKHNPEFTMLEFYIAYKDYNFLMSFTEEMFSFALNKVVGALKIKFGEVELDFTPPWKRVSFFDSFIEKGVPEEILRDTAKATEWGRKESLNIPTGASYTNVIDEIFKVKVEPHLIQPTFITDYPVEISPLSKRRLDKPELVERFELFVMGREIANAFSELNDPIDQRQRFMEQVRAKESGDEEAHWMDEDFLRALEYGMPPAAGEGIGIDRLAMLITDSHSIRDVILFPLLKPEK
ncbi:lysine--tRNA ligase [Candidatus Magnetomonas plexicatena]|uniref:lysine--tRNA ligase n=1 Tax=Candidatus Magnetomonas plexicatena TaxID=2552947 RepID=UPI001C74F5A6|nr:lysine--tRNA ligase [Nitrospirales bacterium LBB_01]